MCKFELTDMLLDYIVPRVYGYNIKEFIANQMSDKSLKRKDITTALYDYSGWINKQSEFIKEDKLEELSNFFLEKMKINFNRVYVQAMMLPASFDFSNDIKLAKRLNIGVNKLNYNKVLSTKFDNKFKEVSRTLQYKDEKVTIIDLVYARAVQAFNQKKPSLQVVWIQLDKIKNEIRVHMPNGGQNLLDENISSNPIAIMDHFMQVLSAKYQIYFSPYNYENVLFNMYKTLTEDLEKDYASKSDKLCLGMDFHNRLTDLIAQNKMVDEIGIEKRFKMLLTRNAIMQDYESFKQSLINKDHVKSITYSEITGSRMSITSGSTNPLDDKDDVQIEESKAYFDTKPTIIDDGKLRSIFVVWKNNRRIRYVALSKFLIIQLLYAHNDLSEGIENDVFRKIREFEV